MSSGKLRADLAREVDVARGRAADVGLTGSGRQCVRDRVRAEVLDEVGSRLVGGRPARDGREDRDRAIPVEAHRRDGRHVGLAGDRLPEFRDPRVVRPCRRAGESRGNQERAVRTLPERGRHEVVGAPSGRRSRKRADVLLAERECQGRQRERNEDRERDHDRNHGVSRDDLADAVPRAPLGVLGRPAAADHAERFEARPEHGEQGGKERHRGTHRRQNRDRGGEAKQGHERDIRDRERADRDHDGRAGKGDGRAVGRNGARD